ncbi:hypothetical protein C3Y87_13235 [Carbonactinospora thermoautotrophica]|uniref:DUF6153 family protein n=1 Tax=Carbonactinospora thermoautotrophica TaxID=1469144 RepID=UPI00226F025D|nr:DUF6153 family protein [Carbonactinospora thermoautotrophica]MCX9192355.1 hypothetical protein [Carbonactinospora thermoautotrophica]
MRWLQEQTPGRSTAGRLLLLLAVLLGVAAMHVLGHPRTGHETRSAVTHGVIAPGEHASVPSTAEGCGTCHTTTPDGHGFDPTSVCMAVLAGSLLLLIPLLRRWGSGQVFALAGNLIRRAPPATGLAPPWALSLPELSVLRL